MSKKREQKQEENKLSTEEKLKRSVAYELTEKRRISNIALLEYKNDNGEKAREYWEFWYDKGERKVKRIIGAKPLDPRVSPNGQTIKQFTDENYYPAIEELYQELKDLQKKFLFHIKDITFTLLACGSIASYFPEVFNQYPYFDIIGSEANCGKSTALRCLTFPSYYGHYVVDPSKATTFRIIDTFNCMMGIDELGKLLNTKQGKHYLSILLNGYEKSGLVPRCKEDNYSQIDFFSVFGLKAWTRLEYIPNQLLSRSIKIHMIRNDGRKETPGKPKYADFTAIRNKLYTYRLINHDNVSKTYKELQKETDLVDRTKEIFLPLLTIAKLANRDDYYNLLAYAKEYHKQAKHYSVDSRLVKIMQLIHTYDFFGIKKVVDLRDRYKEALEVEGEPAIANRITSKTIIKLLERLGFERSEKETDNRVHYKIDRKTFNTQAKIYLKEAYQDKLVKETETLGPLEESLLQSSTATTD